MRAIKDEGGKQLEEVDVDNQILTFGKYKGQTLNQIAETDPDYIVFVYETVSTNYCSKELYTVCQFAQGDNEYDDFYSSLGPLNNF